MHPQFQGGYGPFYNNAVPPTSTNRKFIELAVARANGQPLLANFTRCYRPFGANVVTTNPVGDADEGLAIGGHGYFYSPGLDGDPGTRQDNVYSKQPSFPTETVNFN